MSHISRSTMNHRTVFKVLVFCAQDASRLSLERMLEQPSEFRCVGSYSDGDRAIREAPFIGPDLALMDIQINATSDLGCVRGLKGVHPRLIPVLVTGLTDQDSLAQAVAAGVEGYLAKPFSFEQCLAALRFAVWRSGVQGRKTEQAAERHARRVTNGALRLTGREKQVLEGLAKGLLYKEIADWLGISFSAVHKHQHNIFVKLRVSNRTEAIAKWREESVFPQFTSISLVSS
jgi:two-component system, NarL family, response regulator LiaR